MALRVDPERKQMAEMLGQHAYSGVLVRAEDTDGKIVNADVVILTKDSLLQWLRSRGGKNIWAENFIGSLLGFREPLVDMTFAETATLERIYGELPTRARRAIQHAASYRDWSSPILLKELVSLSPQEWLKVKNFGEKSLRYLAELLVPLCKEHHIDMAEEKSWEKWASWQGE